MSFKNSDSASEKEEFSGTHSISDENAEQRYVSIGSGGKNLIQCRAVCGVLGMTCAIFITSRTVVKS
jgi:hypothetical protein